MHDISLIIQNKIGLHARPAALMVETARKYKSNIQISYDERKVDAKSILSLLSLGVNKNANIIISAEGEDEIEAIESLKKLIESNFGESE
jgi:phosphocarrier protein